MGGATMAEIIVARIGDLGPDRAWRVLVDRLWPRGIKKETALWDEWAKDIAPSHALREWYGHDPERYDEFRRRYRVELEMGREHETCQRLLTRLREGPLALLTYTKDVQHSQGPILREFLLKLSDS